MRLRADGSYLIGSERGCHPISSNRFHSIKARKLLSAGPVVASLGESRGVACLCADRGRSDVIPQRLPIPFLLSLDFCFSKFRTHQPGRQGSS